MMKILSHQDFVNMNDAQSAHPLRVDLAYARGDNLLFGEPIYRPDAQLWLHKDLAAIVISAANRIHNQYGWRFVVYDGLRTTTAQAKMLKTQRVIDNPQWLQEPRLLSPPGAGGHPRGMAVDVTLEDDIGNLLDMGTPFDFLADDPGPEKNPAHRSHPNLTDAVRRNRDILTRAMMRAADDLGYELLPLPQEWWDFRFPASVYEQFAPLSDDDLPEDMRMVR